MTISWAIEVNGAFDNMENVLRLTFLSQVFGGFFGLVLVLVLVLVFPLHVLPDCQAILLLRVRGPSLDTIEFILSCCIQIDVDQETNSLNILELKYAYNGLLLIVRNFLSCV